MKHTIITFFVLVFFATLILAFSTVRSLFFSDSIVENNINHTSSTKNGVDYADQVEIVERVDPVAKIILPVEEDELPFIEFDYLPKTLQSGVVLVGRADSDWFFGVPPQVVLESDTGKHIATGILDIAHPLVEGKNTRFSIQFSFEKPNEIPGYIVIQKIQESSGSTLTYREVIQFELGQKKASFRLTSPEEYAYIESPVYYAGEAVAWYFEGDFPVTLYDAEGVVLGRSYATAQDDWMSYEFVPFVGSLTFNPATTATGTLVFSKDNPSGLPEYDEQVAITVKFK
ncbi:Gmad2 immunoglobulin-like domain-containing protein [Patescibacteria group bacterium]|nr:Gmad2 immunoglobulin-like domain-containing protein [Patescibacteria group bacterium]MBU1721273.1 Gmad2 immunoglobulin-like domain-containing protein [Patescibacteria group bacterium]MBU1901019.1 Gmad2 immunoglobulin-like domain-containing protein [Patescibacteria group bacterium]